MHAPLPNASRTETAHLCEDVYPTPGLRKQTVTAGNGNLEMFIEEDEPKKTAAYRCRSRELGGRQEVRAGTSPPSSEGGRRGPGQPRDRHAVSSEPDPEAQNGTRVQPVLVLQDEWERTASKRQTPFPGPASGPHGKQGG